MNIVLFYNGCNKPYFNICINQIKKYNPSVKIWFVGSDNSFIDGIYKFIRLDELKGGDIERFNKLDYYVSYGTPMWRNLFRTSTQRFFYIERLIEKFCLNDIFHFDMDVLIYDSFDKLLKIVGNENNIFTPINDDVLTCGLFYTKNKNSITSLNTMLISEIETNLNNVNVNEMILLGNIYKKSKMLSLFPTLPHGNYETLYTKYQMLFDSASWGQYVGGITKQNGEICEDSWCESHHHVGNELIKKTYKIKMVDKEPFVIDNYNKMFKLFNLHIHSKNLNKFCSINL